VRAGRFLGTILGGVILAACGAGAVMAKDLKRAFTPMPAGKICDTYGPGFVPWDGNCLQFNSFISVDVGVNQTPYGGPAIIGNLPINVLALSDNATFAVGARTQLAFDARTQTEYGTLRAYLRGGFDLIAGNNIAGSEGSTGALLYYDRAFVQFAGFTAGKNQSYFDIFHNQWTLGPGSFVGGGSDTSANGIPLIAFTAQIGNGFAATLSAEDPTARRNAIWAVPSYALEIGETPGDNNKWLFNFPSSCYQSYSAIGSTAGSAVVGCGYGDYAAPQIPDIVGSLHLDQAWGSLQVSAALHQLQTGFTGSVPATDAWGWATAGGVSLNLPWNPGDKFWVESTYSEGAAAYAGFGMIGGSNNFVRFNDQKVAAGWALDGISGDLPGGQFGGLALSTSWSASAAVEHYWTPALRTSAFGSYTAWSPGATGNAMMCSSFNSPVRTIAGAAPTGAAVLPGCDFGFQVWAVGSRTIWNPVKNLDIGVEVMYSQINQSMDPDLIRFSFGGAVGRPAGLYIPSNEGAWSGMFRVQRNFLP
jgi:hypothetical protein